MVDDQEECESQSESESESESVFLPWLFDLLLLPTIDCNDVLVKANKNLRRNLLVTVCLAAL